MLWAEEPREPARETLPMECMELWESIPAAAACSAMAEDMAEAPIAEDMAVAFMAEDMTAAAAAEDGPAEGVRPEEEGLGRLGWLETAPMAPVLMPLGPPPL